jgi:hypothetical protein
MDYREIVRLAGDPAGVRKIAKTLLASAELTDPQIDFLSDMAEFKGRISTRQGEYLLGIRDDMQEVSTVGYDFSVRILLRRCWEARDELDEADQEFIAKHHGRTTIRYKYCGRLLRCARQLGLID